MAYYQYWFWLLYFTEFLQGGRWPIHISAIVGHWERHQTLPINCCLDKFMVYLLFILLFNTSDDRIRVPVTDTGSYLKLLDLTLFMYRSFAVTSLMAASSTCSWIWAKVVETHFAVSSKTWFVYLLSLCLVLDSRFWIVLRIHLFTAVWNSIELETKCTEYIYRVLSMWIFLLPVLFILALVGQQKQQSSFLE